MKLSKFTLSDNDEVFEGYTDGSLWNGWANVCFTRDQISKFFATTPYEYKFLEVGNPLNGEEYPLLVVYWDDVALDNEWAGKKMCWVNTFKTRVGKND